MIKRLLLLFVFLLCTISGAWASEYHSERYKFHFNLVDNWLLQEDSRQKVISMIHPERIATINVIGFYYPETITANGLQMKRMGSIYDGWVNIFEREGTEEENKKAAVEESYIALYTKHIIGQDLKINEKMVAEYHYIRGQNAYVISLETFKSEWPKVQKPFKHVLNSFWVGDGDKPEPVITKKEQPLRQEITQLGISAENRQFIVANPQLQQVLKKKWSKPITLSTEEVLPLVVDNDVLYTINSGKLQAVNLETGDEVWSFQFDDVLHSSLLIKNDILYFKRMDPEPTLIAVVASRGNVLFKKQIGEVHSALSYINGIIYYVEDEQLIGIDPNTGNTAIEQGLNLNAMFYPVGDSEFVAAVKDKNTLVVCDAENGELIWEKKMIGDLKYSPAIHDGKLIVTYEKLEPVKQSFITAYSLNEGKHLWSFKNRMDKIDILAQPSISNDYMVVPLQVIEVGKTEPIKLLTAFNVNSGDIIWQINSSLNFSELVTPVCTDKYLYLADRRDESFHIIDLVTGEKVPHMFDDTHSMSVKDILFFALYKNNIIKWTKTNSDYQISLYR